MMQLSVLFGKTKKRLDHQVATLLSLDIHSAVNQIPYASLSFTLPSDLLHSKMVATFNATASVCAVGVEVEIKHNDSLMFSGLVTQQSISFKNGKPMMELKLRHRLFTLQTLARSQVFINKTDAAIFNQIIPTDGVQVTAHKVLKLLHEQMVQLNCTDWQFIRARLKANDVWLLPHPEAITFVEPKIGSVKSHHKLTPAGGSTQMLSAQWQSHYVDMPSGVSIHSWDVEKQALSSIKSKAATLGSGGFDPTKIKSALHKPWDISYTMPLTVKEQTELAAAVVTAEQARGIQARFEMTGCADFKLGETLELSDFGSHFDGKALITGVMHPAVSGKWTTVLQTGQEPLAAGADSYDLVPKADGLFVGVVAEMKEDKHFRLQVKIPALGKDSAPLWARFSQPYASKESGICFYPDKDDEVVIAFFEGDPRYPVIMGSMHNAKNKPPFPHTKDNEQRGFVFVHQKEQQTLLFNRKTSQIQLQNFAEEKGQHQSLLLDAKAMIVDLQNNQAAAENKQSLLLDAKKMQVHLQNNIAAAEKKQSVLLDAKAMLIEIDNNLDNADKKQKVLLAAKQMLVEVNNIQEKLQLHKGVTLTSIKDNIALKAQKDITLDATVGLALSSKKHTIKASEALDLQSLKTTIKGTESLTQSGDEVAINATTKMNLKSSATYAVEGLSVEIKGTSTVNIKGKAIDLGP